MFLGFLVVGLPCAYDNIESSNMNFFSAIPGNWYTAASTRADRRIPIWQSLLHAGFCAFLIFYMFILKRVFKKRTYEFDEDHTTPSDFTVWVKDLDPNYNPLEIKAFYEKRGLGKGSKLEVSAVSPVYDIEIYVQKVRKLQEAKGDLLFLEEYFKRYDKKPSTSCCAGKNYSKAYLTMEITSLERWLKNFEKENSRFFTQSNSAFVTFKHQTVAKKVLKFWHRSIFTKILLFVCYPLRCCCCCCYSSKRFRGKIVNTIHAPEPSDLMWENLSIDSIPKYFRRGVTIITTIILLLIVCVAIFEIKSYQFRTYQDLETKKATGVEISDSALLKVKSIAILMSFVVILMGRVIAVSVRLFSSYEKHISWTSYHAAVVNKLIVATSLNSIVVLLVINLLTTQYLQVDLPGIEVGNTMALYQSYGLANDLFYLMCTDAVVSPLTYVLSPLYIAKACKRRSVKKQMQGGMRLMTQKEANELWENPPVDMAQRYANYMKTLLICFAFAPIFPLGLLIGMVSMFLQYWTDKIMLLRRHPRPPSLSNALSDNMIQWMPILLIAYSVKFI